MSPANHPPRHVAIIMDGNGRWAKKRGLPRLMGHRAGANNIHPVVRIFAGCGVSYLTLYAFSTENWNRPKEEVAGLLRLLAEGIEQEIQAFHEENIKLVLIGRPDKLPRKLKQKVAAATELTRNNTGLTLCLAFDYGAHDEIMRAVQRIIGDGIPADRVNEAVFSRYLYTNDIPDPDLIIRTGGEIRLSNFLLWQAAYSEFYFTPVLWPDFGQEDIEKSLSEYRYRRRRFGSV